MYANHASRDMRCNKTAVFEGHQGIGNCCDGHSDRKDTNADFTTMVFGWRFTEGYPCIKTTRENDDDLSYLIETVVNINHKFCFFVL